jgi:hypothetical protein
MMRLTYREVLCSFGRNVWDARPRDTAGTSADNLGERRTSTAAWLQNFTASRASTLRS